jgi:hypothetical protein
LELYESENTTNKHAELLHEDDDEKVDYEAETIGVVLAVPPSQRPLTEYSPERKIPIDSNETRPLVPPKRPCVNFSKFGNCRFGENCRYSHLQAPRKRQSSRIKLSNLPPNLMNPEALNAEMIQYGSVLDMSIYPERGEAAVQFVNFEDAERAVKEVNDNSSEDSKGIVAELETQKPPHHKAPYQPQPQRNTDNRDKLQSLIQLQKQQQTLLETNLSSQQALLNILQGPTISSEERIEVIGGLKRIQDSVVSIQEMLKRTTELVIETASSTHTTNSFSTKPPQLHKRLPQQYPSQSHNINNVRGANIHKWTSKSASYANNNTNALRASSNNTLDLRSTTLKLAPLKDAKLTDIHALQRHFSPYGPIQSLIITEEGQSAIVKYQKFSDAQRALQNAGKDFGSNVDFSFVKP